MDDFHDLSLKVGDVQKGDRHHEGRASSKAKSVGNLKSRIQDLTLSERDLQTQLGNLREMRGDARHECQPGRAELQGLSQKLVGWTSMRHCLGLPSSSLESDLRSTYRRTGDAEVIEEEMKE